MGRELKKLAFFTLLLVPALVLGDIYSSSNYQVLDPVIDIGGGVSTSTSFSLIQTFGQYMLGTTTATNFTMQSGFLAYPVCSSAVLSTTAGGGQVALSWTASQAWVGWSVIGYDVGVSTASGGPYTYQDVGNVLSYTKTGLSAGTTYYFKVRTKDAFSNEICLSSEASATPTTVATPTPTPGPGGGGPPSVTPPIQVVFSGFAYPLAEVVLLKDGHVAAVGRADNLGDFEIAIGHFSKGDYIFAIYARDNRGRNSQSLSLPVAIGNDIIYIEDIFIPPTLDSDKLSVKKGQNIILTGQSYPNSEVFLFIEPVSFFAQINTGHSGNYSFRIDTKDFDYGEYFAKSNSVFGDLVSQFSRFSKFEVGLETVPKLPEVCPPRGDYNGDCRVNIVDFSILMYWFNSRGKSDRVDENKDGVVDIYDFSIMAYYWTG